MECASSALVTRLESYGELVPARASEVALTDDAARWALDSERRFRRWYERTRDLREMLERPRPSPTDTAGGTDTEHPEPCGGRGAGFGCSRNCALALVCSRWARRSRRRDPTSTSRESGRLARRSLADRRGCPSRSQDGRARASGRGIVRRLVSTRGPSRHGPREQVPGRLGADWAHRRSPRRRCAFNAHGGVISHRAVHTEPGRALAPPLPVDQI